jgi:hypothetical protein
MALKQSAIKVAGKIPHNRTNKPFKVKTVFRIKPPSIGAV